MKSNSVLLIVLTMLRRGCGAVAAALLLAGAAQAATFNFNGAAVVPVCPLSGTTYTCSSLPNGGDTDVIIIASGYTVVVTSSVNFSYNQGLQMSGTATLQSKNNLDVGDVNPANLKVTGGELKADGTFSAGTQAQTIKADISAATINIGTGSTTKITGKLTATSQITLASNVSVIGDVDGPTVLLKSSNTSVKGDIKASSSLTIESNNTVNGNITGGALTMKNGGVVINGNATMTGDVSIGSSGMINGDLTARNVSTHSSNSGVNGNAAVNSIYLDWNTSVSKTITCTGAGASGCSCVTKADSNYKPTCGAAPAAGPHHIQISHSGNALTCQPQTVTLTACANANCTAPHSSASVNVTLLPGGKQFTITGGINTAATVERATEGTAVLSSSSHAYTCVNSGDAAHPCDMIFKKSGLTVSAPNHVSMTAATLTIQALTASANNQSCVPLVAGKTVSVDMGCAYNNPASGTIKPKIGSTSLTCGGTTAVQMSFNAGGTATPALEYADVGKLDLTASYAATSGGTAFNATGSGSFIAAPKEFKIVATNPATAVKTPTSGVFAKASEPFTVQVSAINAAGQVAPNFGRETTPESIIFLDPVVANAAGEGSNGSIVRGQFKPITNGVSDSKDGSAGQWSFSDVGAIRLDAKLANTGTYYLDYATPDFQTKGTLTIGRFIPDHFDTAVMTNSEIDALAATQPLGRSMSCAPNGVPLAAGVNPCATGSLNFIHSKQLFFMKVLAYNGASPPALTRNYAGTLAKAVATTVWTAAGGATVPTGGVFGWNGADPKFSFTAGIGMPASPGPPGVNLPSFTFSKAYPEDVLPATIYLRAIDTDGVSSKRGDGIISVEAPLTVVSGRLMVSNGYGSQNSALPVEVSAQYYMPSGYVFNPQVNAASAMKVAEALTTAPGGFSNCRNKLDVSGNNTYVCPGAATLKAANNDVLTLVKGKGKFLLAAPTPTLTGTGSADVSLGLIFDYLPSSKGRETFGVYRSGPVIYTREVHN